MNSTTSNFDIYSTFTYDDINKYFESLNKCNSDSDCPENSNCIGNKCNTSFYCKEGDNSKCALFKNFCDGKFCYKPNEQCNKSDDCLSGQCDNSCVSKLYSEETHSYTNLINEYSISHFTYGDAKNYFEKLNNTCTSNENCPYHAYCIDDFYTGTDDFYTGTDIHYCNGNEECSGHCIGHFYCKKDKSDCSFNYDEDDGIRFLSAISSSRNVFGLENGRKCRYDGECLDSCIDKNFFGVGRCNHPSNLQFLEKIGFAFFLFALIFIIASVGFCISVILCIKGVENHNRKKKGLGKKKYKALKPLIIIGAIALSILVLFIILLLIDYSLNK